MMGEKGSPLVCVPSMCVSVVHTRPGMCLSSVWLQRGPGLRVQALFVYVCFRRML